MDIDTLGTTDRVFVEVIIARAPSTIFTVFTKRTQLQDWTTFLPGVFAAYLGLTELFLTAMGYFEDFKMKVHVKPDHPLDLLEEMVRE